MTDREIEALRIPEPYEVKPWPRYSDIRIAPAPAGGAVGLPGIHLREVKQFFDGPASTVTPKDLRDLGKLIRTRGRG